MVKTQQQYYDEIYKKGLVSAEGQKAQRETADAQMLEQIRKSIDDAANTTAGMYQKEIDAAPQKYQAAYDENAVNEAFARMRLKESMANMGLTDSGYSAGSTMALTLQRGKADAAVSAEQREYVRKLEDAIDAVRADAAQQKKAQELSVESERRKWWDGVLSDLHTSSSTAAAEMYAADQKYQAEQAKAAAEYAAKLNEQRQSSLTKLNEQRESYALHMMKNMDYTEEQAWAAAYARYPSGDAKTDGYYSMYNRAVNGGYSPEEATLIAQSNNPDDVAAQITAKNKIGNTNLLAGGASGWDDWQIGFSTLFGGGLSGGVTRTVKEVDKELAKNATYTSAASDVKSYMKAYAVGNALKAYYQDNVKTRGNKVDAMSIVESLPSNLNDSQVKIIASVLGLSV